MTHPLVNQLKFARSEWQRGLDGVSDADGSRRFEPINSLGWIVGHMAWHENLCWNVRGQAINPSPQLHDVVGYGKPASTPALSEMLAAWRAVTAAAEPYLEALDTTALLTHWTRHGKTHPESIGTVIQRVIYHYLFHTGESQAIRQLLNHPGRPEYIGDFGAEYAYKP